MAWYDQNPGLLEQLMLLGGPEMSTGGIPTSPAPTMPDMVPTGLTTPANAAQPVPLLTTPAPARPVEPYMTDPLIAGTPPQPPPIAQPASLGASLEPMVPMPRPRPAEAPGGATPNAGRAGPTMSDAKGLSDTLKSVVGPTAPQAQKVSTPHAPPMAKMAAGNVAELLASLGIGPQQAFPGLKLPSTLGQALGGR